MRNFRIFIKLFLTHSAVGLFALITLSVIFYNLLRDALIERTLDQLSSINILKKELVDSGKMTYKQYHDAVLQENAMPVEMVRAILNNQLLTKDFKTNWKFYKKWVLYKS